MALVEPFMIKSSINLGADDVLELTAKSGESFMIKDVIVDGSNDDYVLLEIDKTTVGFFRVSGHVLGSHLPSTIAYVPGGQTYRGFFTGGSISLISYLVRKGYMEGYPVAEGQTFRVKPYTTGKKLSRVMIIYEKYDAGDIKADMVNGSEASEYIFVNYGRPSENLTTGGDYEVSQCVTTKEFPDFPYGANVPSKTQIEILGILGSECINYSASDTYTYTKYLKMFKGRTCLFDNDKNGLPFYMWAFSGISAGTHFGRGFSVIGNYTEKDRREPFTPPTPLVFKEGDEVKVYITAGKATNAGSIDTEYAEIAFIERVKVAE